MVECEIGAGLTVIRSVLYRKIYLDEDISGTGGGLGRVGLSFVNVTWDSGCWSSALEKTFSDQRVTTVAGKITTWTSF